MYQIVLHTHTHTHTQLPLMSSSCYISHFPAASTPLNLTLCHVPCTSTKCTNYCSALGEMPMLPAATETHNRHIFTLPQHNLQNISTVSEGGSAPHGPHILHSIISVLHLMTAPCVLVTNPDSGRIKNLNNIQQLQIFTHINTATFLANVPHFTKTMAHCPQVSIIWTSPPPTVLQLIQYIYMHTYSVHLSLSYSTLCYKIPTCTQGHLEALQREITSFC